MHGEIVSLLKSARPIGFGNWLRYNVMLPLFFPVVFVPVIAVHQLAPTKGLLNALVAPLWRGDLVMFSCLLVIGVLIRLYTELANVRQQQASREALVKALESEFDKQSERAYFIVASLIVTYVCIKLQTFTSETDIAISAGTALLSVCATAISVGYCAYLQFRASYVHVLVLTDAYREIATRTAV